MVELSLPVYIVLGVVVVGLFAWAFLRNKKNK